MDKVFVLSVTDRLVGTSDVYLFKALPGRLEVMDILGEHEDFLSYNDIREHARTLRDEQSLSTVCRFYEISHMEVR